jgi:hypothetical protein
MTTLNRIVLELNEEGWRVTQGHLPHDLNDAEPKDAANPAKLENPRWSHWYQRRLVRVWMAVMLSLNYEPSKGSRAALKRTHPDKYQDYLDRRDIATALAGQIDELGVFSDHVREGEGAGAQYIELADFYRFAASNGWPGLEPMRDGLRMKTDPPKNVLKAADTNGKKGAQRVLATVLEAMQPGILRSESELLALKPQLLEAAKRMGAGFTLSPDTIDTHLKETWDQIVR